MSDPNHHEEMEEHYKAGFEKQITELHQAVFSWFCDNGYAPPMYSEIDDLLNRIKPTPENPHG